jgi:hypothetical protein
MMEVQTEILNPENTTKKKQNRWLPLLLFCIAAGLLATLWGYNYTAGNAEEQLPFIFRAMDHSYLARDFFTNTFLQYGPRTIFSEFVAFFARSIPLTAVLFLLTFIANVSIAYLSSTISSYFFPESKFSAFLAAAGVLTLKTFWLGYSNIVYRNFLEPEHLAMPLLLLGFWFILKRKYVFAAFAFGIAALFHALLGLEVGWILLGLLLVDFIIQKLRKETNPFRLKSLLFAFLVLGVFSFGLLYPYTLQKSIPASEFVHLVAYVRHPHHYMPSFFDAWQWVQAAVYLTGFGFVFWFSLNQSAVLRNYKRYLLLIAGSIVILCVGGTLFVEVWPSRLWTSAQMFRLPYIIKWFSLVVLAGWVGYLIEKPAKRESRLFGLTAGIALVTPATLAFVPVADWIRKNVLPRLKHLKLPAWLTGNLMILIFTLALIVIFKPDLHTWALFLILFGAIWIMFLLRWKPIGLLISSIGILALAGLFFSFASTIKPPSFLKSEAPFFSLYQTSGELADVAKYAKANTPADAIFLTPPNYGEFRYMADRAIVVDFTAYPFQDQSMQEWYQRIVDCYGVTDIHGFPSLDKLNQSVYYYTDARLKVLSKKYGFDYAIVYDSTVTNYPIIFRTTELKLIHITN